LSNVQWNQGYVVDQAYTAGFYKDLTPEHLNYACVLSGVEPVPLNQPFTYFELGCGQGLTTTLMAASHPQGRFYANDFMPAHVADATQLAGAARLNNLTFLENSFAELAEGKVELPQFDFITMHGVYSWVSAENRQHLVKFMSRYLKPGGIVYVSYNAAPGWVPMTPVHRFIRSHAELQKCEGTGSVKKLEAARKFLTGMIDTGGEYFVNQPGLKPMLDLLRDADPHYLVHEYMNQTAHPLYLADVAADFSAGKLDYVCSSILVQKWAQLPFAQQQLVDTVSDPLWRETVRDFMVNTKFRRDIFVRGRRNMSKARQLACLQQCTVALVMAPEEAQQANFLPDFKAEILELLAKGPCTLSEFAQLSFCDGDLEFAARLTASLSSLKVVAIFVPTNVDEAVAATCRLNFEFAQRALFEDRYQVLGSALMGWGLKTSVLQRLVYLQLVQQPSQADAQSIAYQIHQILKNQVAINAEADGVQLDLADITTQVARVLREYVPMWKQLKVL
jgi:SAM-dependent methyltransferase